AAESAVAAVDAVDPQTLSLAAGDGAAAFADQRAADGPPAASAEDAAATAHLRAHQTRLSAQAPHSGEDRSLGRGEEAVQRALNEIAGVLPFALLGVDSDNGSEFINWHLKSWCEQRQIQ